MALTADKDTYDWLIGLLKTNKVQVIFTKSDGTERTMNCTLREDIVVPYEKKTEKVKQTNEDVLPVWDLDNNAWRSFKLSTIKAVETGVIVQA